MFIHIHVHTYVSMWPFRSFVGVVIDQSLFSTKGSKKGRATIDEDIVRECHRRFSRPVLAFKCQARFLWKFRTNASNDLKQ